MLSYTELSSKLLQLESGNIRLHQENTHLRSMLAKEANVENASVSFDVNTQQVSQFLISMLDHVPAMIGYWDKNLINRFSNKAYSDWFGVSANNLYGKHIKELLGESLLALNMPYIEAVLNGMPQVFEREIPSPDCTSTRFSITEYIPNFVDDQVAGFIVQVSDITSIKKSELLLRQSEERYRLVVQDQSELISRLRVNGAYLFANEAFLRFFGKKEEELIGFKWMPLVYADDLSHVVEELSKLAPTNPVVMIENRVYSGNGDIHWMQFSNRGTFNEQGEITEIQSVGRDITEHKQADQALKLANEVYQNVVDAILVTDANKVVLSVNPAFTNISGFSAEEVIGDAPSMFKSTYHNDGFYQSLWEKVAQYGFWHGEIWNNHKNGEINPYLMTISSIANSRGGISNYVCIFTDNSEFKKLENQRLRDEKSNRETLVREVHHRIKNNLHGVVGLLNNAIDLHPDLTQTIRNAISKVKSIAAIHGLQGNNASNSINLIHLLNSVIENHQTLFRCKISLSVSEECIPILIIEREAVPTALILNELILNSIKHTTERDSIGIKCFYDAVGPKVVIQIRNIGQLSSDLSNKNPKFGTGLKLVESLLPKQNVELSWEQENDHVVTTIKLSSPIFDINI
jgi:PAS domain S-box-containing protein